jgi:hypothetical protein
MRSVAIVAKLSDTGIDAAMVVRVLCKPAWIRLWNYPVLCWRWCGSGRQEAVCGLGVKGRKIVIQSCLRYWMVKEVGISWLSRWGKKGSQGIEQNARAMSCNAPRWVKG